MVEISEEQYNEYIKLKELHKKGIESKKKHFLLKKKDLCKTCDICNLDVKINSFSNHIKSKKHIKELGNKNI